jgi:hypothetical protein
LTVRSVSWRRRSLRWEYSLYPFTAQIFEEVCVVGDRLLKVPVPLECLSL